MSDHILSVLIVEDDPMVANLHQRFISVMEGFTVVGIARTGTEALKMLGKGPVDLVLLDIFMPGIDGLELLRNIREKRKNTDVIMITAAQEGAIIQEALRLGVFDYLLKPFEFTRFKETLHKLREHHQGMQSKQVHLNQDQIDQVFSRKIKFHDDPEMLPKGIQKNTLERILEPFKSSSGSLSLYEVAEITGLSRVTVKRYVQFLLQSGRLTEETHYQEVGRPLNKYLFIK
ncbi:MAG: response regulator [Synergistales bacterium]|nr:response regulator [Synergistales bacterium]